MNTTTSKTDLRQYSGAELSLQFNNVESLYNDYMRAVRRNDFSLVKEICDDLFTYSSEQLEELEQDFDMEVDEYNNQ